MVMENSVLMTNNNDFSGWPAIGGYWAGLGADKTSGHLETGFCVECKLGQGTASEL